MLHISVIHCSKLHSPQTNGSGEEDDDDDDSGLSIEFVEAGMVMVIMMMNKMAINKTVERTMDRLYSAGRIRLYSSSFSGDMYTVVDSSLAVEFNSMEPMDW